MATFKEAEEYAGQNSCPPYPHSELGATENSAKSEQQGTLMAQTAKPMPSQTGKGEEISFCTLSYPNYSSS